MLLPSYEDVDWTSAFSTPVQRNPTRRHQSPTETTQREDHFPLREASHHRRSPSGHAPETLPARQTPESQSVPETVGETQLQPVPEVPAQPTGTTQSSEVDRSKIVALII